MWNFNESYVGLLDGAKICTIGHISICCLCIAVELVFGCQFE